MSDTDTLPVAAPVIANELTVILAPERDDGVQLGAPDLPKSTRDTVQRVVQHGLTLFVLLCVALMGFLFVGTDVMHSRYQRALHDTFVSMDQLQTLPGTSTYAESSTSSGASANGQITTQPAQSASPTQSPPPIPTGTPVALLKIPRIDVSEVVTEGTSSAQTLRGPGHLPATPLPGQLGNTVVIGRHSTGGSPFGSLGSLKPGEHFSFVVGSGTASYRVVSVRTYRASNMSIFATQRAAGKSINTATLVTSTSLLDSNRRLAVIGQLQGTPAGFTPGHVAPNDSDLGLALNSSGLLALAIALQLLLLASIGAVWLVKRWHRFAAWTVATPVVLCGTWLVFEQFAHILPSAL
jgi:sortase A